MFAVKKMKDLSTDGGAYLMCYVETQCSQGNFPHQLHEAGLVG